MSAENGKREVAELEARVQELDLSNRLMREAALRGLEPAAVAGLADRSMIVRGEDGEPLNVLEVVDAVVEAHPVLLNAGRGRPQPPRSSKPDPRFEQARAAALAGDGVIRFRERR